MTATSYYKTIFHVGEIGDGFTITRATLRRMVHRFWQLRRMGLVLPVRLGHHPGHREHPVPRAEFRRVAVADRRVQGYVRDVRLSPDEQALRVVVTFVRQRGRDAAAANRMALSPVLDRPQFGRDNGLLGDLACIDLVPHGADQSQGLFHPVLQTVRSTPTPRPKTQGVRRMSEIKMPALTDQQIAVLKRIDQTRQHMGLSVDWWPSAIQLLWPDQAVEILGTDPAQEHAGSLQETAPEFAAMSLDRAAADAKQYVNAQAERMGGMLR